MSIPPYSNCIRSECYIACLAVSERPIRKTVEDKEMMSQMWQFHAWMRVHDVLIYSGNSCMSSMNRKMCSRSLWEKNVECSLRPNGWGTPSVIPEQNSVPPIHNIWHKPNRIIWSQRNSWRIDLSADHSLHSFDLF